MKSQSIPNFAQAFSFLLSCSDLGDGCWGSDEEPRRTRVTNPACYQLYIMRRNLLEWLSGEFPGEQVIKEVPLKLSQTRSQIVAVKIVRPPVS